LSYFLSAQKVFFFWYCFEKITDLFWVFHFSIFFCISESISALLKYQEMASDFFFWTFIVIFNYLCP
jgi:hypothetical protein